ASSSCACRRIARAGSRPNCSSATNARSGRWLRRWRRCMCRVFRPAKLRRLPRSCAATASRPPRSARSTSGWMRAWRNLPAEAFPYLILDARYERVREAGVIASQAVLIAIGIDWDGRRQVLAVELANRESRSSWRDFLVRLKARGLHGVEFAVADDHAGLRAALREALTEAAYQRCYVHFLRNALDYVPRRVDDDCLQEPRWLYDRRDLAEARRDLAAWVAKWSGKYAKLTGWVEDNIDETLTFYRLPRQHHKHLKSTNMLERLNEEIKRLWSDNLDGTAYCLTRECSPAIERCLTMFAPGASSRSARIR